MSVKVAKSAGFCFGVNRAVELVEQAAQSGKKVATLLPDAAACSTSSTARLTPKQKPALLAMRTLIRPPSLR